MAKEKNKTTEKKKKRGIVQRMMFGDDQKPDLTSEQMNMSSWETFKYLFFHRFGTMAALSLLSAIFAIPMILVLVLFTMNIRINNGFIPYSSNMGIGYPVVINAAQIGAETVLTYKTMECLILVPCIAVFALGISGNLYVIRKLIWEEPTSTVKDFFRGIKKCWLPSVIVGMVVGLTILLFIFTINFFNTYSFATGVKVLCIILASILLVFISIFSAFLLTQNAAFKMRPLVLIRNSLLFVVGTHIISIIFIGIAIAPTLLFLIPGGTVIIGIIYALIGISFSTLVISTYCHSCYRRFLYDKIDGKPASAVYQKRPTTAEEQRAAAEKSSEGTQKKRQAPVPYKNPKKRKKSIDEGTSITPLAPTFRREDLERLEKEHQDIMKESDLAEDDELGEIDDDLPDRDEAVENVADGENFAESSDEIAEDNENADGDDVTEDGDEEFAELTDAEKWL